MDLPKCVFCKKSIDELGMCDECFEKRKDSILELSQQSDPSEDDPIRNFVFSKEEYETLMNEYDEGKH